MSAPLRLLVLGTAGTGKTFTLKCAVEAARSIFKSFDSVLMVAHTGVAAANMGGGAATINSVFKFASNNMEEDLDGDRLNELVESLSKTRLIIIDEISTVGSAQLEMISRRLEQVAKSIHQRSFNKLDPPSFDGFGNFGIVLVGDFGQIPPVLATSLLGQTLQESSHSGLRSRAIQGQRRFQAFDQIICLKRIYRQKVQDDYKDSTIRLRDAVCTPDDWKLWKSHEIQNDAALRSDSLDDDFLVGALHLTIENSVCGAINGEKLKKISLQEKRDVKLKVVLRCKATHNDDRGRHKPASDFRNLRDSIHMALLAPVMLTQNQLYDVNTVSVGLMNGARGVIVAVLYNDQSGYPDGKQHCPMPEYVIVHFPSYSGMPFFEGCPTTWVPIPQVCITHKERKALIRTATPLRLSWAMTVHKAQGLTAKEGCVVDLRVRSKRNPIALPGLAFVAWTRTESFDRLAFRDLPPLLDFFERRQHKDFKQREKFELQATKKHEAYALSQGVTQEQEIQQHYAYTERKKGSPLCEDEKQEIKTILTRQGMQPLSQELEKWIAEHEGAVGGSTLQSIARSFKGKRAKAASEGIKDTSKIRTAQQSKNKREKKDFDLSEDLYKPLLLTMGFDEGVVKAVLNVGVLDLNWIVDQCLEESPEVVLPLKQTESDYLKKNCDAIGLALRSTEDASAVERKKKLARRRSCKKKTFSILMPTSHVYLSYIARANSLYPRKEWNVWDFGIAADNSINACFWLSVVAGLSRMSEHYASSDTELSVFLQDTQALKEVSLETLSVESRPVAGNDLLGKLARRLRILVCGENGYMLQKENVCRWAPAFAYLQQEHDFSASFSDYVHWVRRVADCEYADELVLSATAEMLKVELSVLPYTPPGAKSQWAVWNSQNSQQLELESNRILLGNDDVHYVLLF